MIIVIKLRKEWYFSNVLTLTIPTNDLEKAIKIARKRFNLSKFDIIEYHEERRLLE